MLENTLTYGSFKAKVANGKTEPFFSWPIPSDDRLNAEGSCTQSRVVERLAAWYSQAVSTSSLTWSALTCLLATASVTHARPVGADELVKLHAMGVLDADLAHLIVVDPPRGFEESRREALVMAGVSATLVELIRCLESFGSGGRCEEAAATTFESKHVVAVHDDAALIRRQMRWRDFGPFHFVVDGGLWASVTTKGPRQWGAGFEANLGVAYIVPPVPARSATFFGARATAGIAFYLEEADTELHPFEEGLEQNTVLDLRLGPIAGLGSFDSDTRWSGVVLEAAWRPAYRMFATGGFPDGTEPAWIMDSFALSATYRVLSLNEEESLERVATGLSIGMTAQYLGSAPGLPGLVALGVVIHVR